MNFKRMMRLGRQAGTLKADHPGAWLLGEELAREALADRSPDLARMMRERSKEGIEFYVRQVSEGVVRLVADGEIEISEPVTEKALEALGIACGMTLYDALDKEAR